jgi:hypothetical protein
MYSEALLHFAWKFKLIPQKKLFSFQGDKIEIIDERDRLTNKE